MVNACTASGLSPLGSLAEADNPQNAPPVQLGVCIQLGSPGGQRPEQVGELRGWPQLQVPRQNAVHGHPGLQPSTALQSRYQLLGTGKDMREPVCALLITRCGACKACCPQAATQAVTVSHITQESTG